MKVKWIKWGMTTNDFWIKMIRSFVVIFLFGKIECSLINYFTIQFLIKNVLIVNVVFQKSVY